jgi:hypothetical protein
MEGKRLLIVSFDAVGSEELAYLGDDAYFRRIASGGTIFDKTRSITVSNTYPVHASISTGRMPGMHGLISNTAMEPESGYGWRWDSRDIKSRTIFQAAKDKGLETAAIMWPVTGYAGRTIKYNFPEILAAKDQSTLAEYMRAGSRWFDITSYIKFGKLLCKDDPSQQPQKDDFAVAVLENLLRHHRPDLMMLHLTAYDAACHIYGKHSPESIQALRHLDENLGRIMKCIGDDTSIIVFSDHCQLNYSKFCDPDKATEVKFSNQGHRMFYFYCCGGTCFCFPRAITEKRLCELKGFCLGLKGVQRLVTEQEMEDSGFAQAGAAFGLGACEDYVFDQKIREKAEHGYTLDRDHYGTFIMTSWKEESQCTDVLDVTRLAAQVLGVQYKGGIV